MPPIADRRPNGRSVLVDRRPNSRQCWLLLSPLKARGPLEWMKLRDWEWCARPQGIHTRCGAPPDGPATWLKATVFDWEAPVFDWEAPVVDWEAPVFEWEAPVFEWEVPVLDWDVPVFDWEAPVFDPAT
jgi:hypothetical protein